MLTILFSFLVLPRDGGHRRLNGIVINSRKFGWEMQRTLAQAIERLALAGEQAGISVEEMIQILNAGVRVEALLDLIGGIFRLPWKQLAPPLGSCSLTGLDYGHFLDSILHS